MLQINSLAHAISKNVLFIKFLPFSIGQVKILSVGQNFDLHLSTHLWYRSTHQVMPRHYDFICNIVCIVWCIQEYGSPPIYNPCFVVRAHRFHIVNFKAFQHKKYTRQQQKPKTQNFTYPHRSNFKSHNLSHLSSKRCDVHLSAILLCYNRNIRLL